MKRKLISLMTAVTMLASLFGAMPITASAADVSASSIKLGDYVELGGIKWRCVAFEKATGNVIDSTQTSQTYKDGYLPLMLADTSIGEKQFDAAGNNTSGSHGRGDINAYRRTNYGSNYWGDSNIRDWLNSDSLTVTYTCGNEPPYASEAGFLTKFSDSEKAAMRTVTQKSLLAEADKNVPGASGSKVHEYNNNNIANVVQNYSTARSEQVTDTIFLLDVQQVYNVYSNDASLGGTGYYKPSSSYYWLRSPYSGTNVNVRAVFSDGFVYAPVDYGNYGVRPAFFLNPSAMFVCGDGTAGNSYKQSHSIGNGYDENGHYTYCTNCKEEFSRGAHTYRADNSKHYCTACAYSAKHTYNENHICTVCNHACSHSRDYQYQTTTGHYKVCSDCGRRTDTEPHTYKQKTGDKTYHYCSVCNYSQNHSFGAWHVAGDIRKRDCSICGYADTGEYTKPIHDKPHNICCDDTCTEHEKFSWWVVPLADNLVNVGGKKNQCLVPAAFTLSTVWEFPDFVATLSGDNKNKVDNCLYANTLTLSNGAYINIKNGQTYSLTDCYKGLGTVTGGTNGVIKIENGGAFNFFEGTITGNGGSSGIIENSGTTNIYGGTITGNTGTVIKNSGTLNIYGGAITNNTGAAIENSGTVNIYGGAITNNAGGGIIGTGTINFKEGNPVIESNTVDNVICNVKGANTITVTALGEDASIGFTPATAVTAGNPKEISANGGEYYSHFVSDNGDYAIIQSGSKIQLIAAHSVLEHNAAKAATCTEGGNDEYWSCVDCNRLYSDKDGNTEIYAIPTTEATGHSLTHHEEKAATCMAGGNREYWECTACGNIFEDEEATREIDGIPTIDATGHNLIEREAQAATCTEDGNSAYWECMGCGKLFSDENGTTEISAIPTIAAKGHTWGTWTVKTPATETAKGEEQRECSVCHTTETRDIPVSGHTHTMTAHAAKAATCTESGNIAYWECSGCNKLFSDANGTTEITKADTIIAAKGHTEVEIPAVAATCTKGGKTAGVKCSVCGTILTAPTETAALGHSWSAWEITKSATETEDGEKSRECSRCNETETQVIPATGHTCDWGDWTITTAPTLTATGKAERVCKTNANHKDSVDLPVLTDTTVWTAGARVEPTETEDGEQIYTSEYGNVTVVLPATGTDKFSIRYEGGNAIVTAPTAGTYTVLFAAYDGSGRLTNLSAQTVTVEKGETTVTLENFTANGTVKVMLWESLLSMKPLCEAGK